MDPQSIFCPNPECPARGQTGQGNIGIHSQREQRYICHVCRRTFAASTGTAYYRLHKAGELMTLMVTLLAYGCPLQAIVVAFGLGEWTVQAWHRRAGQHCERVHVHLVEQPRDLGQVQADELRVKTQGGVLWVAMALQVSTRLWLGATLSPQRNQALITALIQKVRAVALCRPLLFCVDGLVSYVAALQTVSREAVPTGRAGCPRLRPWDGIAIAQVVCQTAQRPSGRRHRAPPGPGCRGVDPPDPRGRRHQHGVYRARERHLSQPAGGFGAPRAGPGATPGHLTPRRVLDGRGLQLLHRARQPAHTRHHWRAHVAAAYARHGCRLSRPLLVGPRATFVSRPAAAVDTT